MGVSPFPMPSIVPKARKTKVNLGGSRKGRSACVPKRSLYLAYISPTSRLHLAYISPISAACVAKRSCPILVRRLRRDAFFSSGVIWFSHLAGAREVCARCGREIGEIRGDGGDLVLPLAVGGGERGGEALLT